MRMWALHCKCVHQVAPGIESSCGTLRLLHKLGRWDKVLLHAAKLADYSQAHKTGPTIAAGLRFVMATSHPWWMSLLFHRGMVVYASQNQGCVHMCLFGQDVCDAVNAMDSARHAPCFHEWLQGIPPSSLEVAWCSVLADALDTPMTVPWESQAAQQPWYASKRSQQCQCHCYYFSMVHLLSNIMAWTQIACWLFPACFCWDQKIS